MEWCIQRKPEKKGQVSPYLWQVLCRVIVLHSGHEENKRVDNNINHSALEFFLGYNMATCNYPEYNYTIYVWSIIPNSGFSYRCLLSTSYTFIPEGISPYVPILLQQPPYSTAKFHKHTQTHTSINLFLGNLFLLSNLSLKI